MSALGAPSASLPITFPNPVADHETIPVAVVNYSAAPLTVVDNYANTYIPIANDPTNTGCSLYYAKNVTGSGGVANFTITVTFAAPEFAWVVAHDVSGCDRTSPLDKFAVTPGTGGTPSTASVTTTANGEYIFGVFSGFSGSAFSGSGPGFTGRESFAGGLALSEDQIQSAAGAIAATFVAAAGAWTSGIATFKAAAGPKDNAVFFGCNT